MSSILKEIAKGAAWSTGAQWIAQVSQIFVSVILARILIPADYGIVGMSAAFTGFIVLFANLGMGPAIVQRQNIDEDYLHTALWATVGVSVTLYLAAYVLAPWVGAFYSESRVTSIVRVASIGFLLSPLNGIMGRILTREMRFKALAFVDVLCTFSSQATALVAALLGMGVWSLVFGSIAFQIVRIVLMLWITDYRPRLRFDIKKFKDLFSFGWKLLGSNFLGYLGRNADNLIIGKILGATALGYYDLAYQIMLRPITNISGTISKPLFPALARLQHKKDEAAEVYRKVVSYISIITMPVMFGIAAVAPELIICLVGEKWAPAIPVVQILALVGALQSIGCTVGDIYLSQNRTDIMLKLYIFGTPITIACFLIGTIWGITGVALFYAINCLLYSGLSHYIANSIITLSNRKFYSSIMPSFFAGAVMAIFVILFRYLFEPYVLNTFVFLTFLVTMGAIVYILMIILLKNEEFLEVKQFIVGKISFLQNRFL